MIIENLSARQLPGNQRIAPSIPAQYNTSGDFMKKFTSEFRKFISRGNVVDMATGMVIGASFTAIVNSLVNDIIMPIVGVLIGGVDFSSFRIVLKAATETEPAVTLNYGTFVNTIITFLIVSFAIFCVVKSMNKLHEKQKSAAAKDAPAPASPPADIQLLTEIRDLLKNQNS